MSFKSAEFGVNFWGDKVKVEEIKDRNDYSNYDFLIIDKIGDNVGYRYYHFDIVPLKENEYIEFFGWKIKGIDMPSNNYREYCWCKMLDYFGQESLVDFARQFVYETNRVEMIERILNGAIEFAKKNYSIEYYNFIEDNDFYKHRNTINYYGFSRYNTPPYFTVEEQIKRTKERVEQYNKLMGYFQDQSKRTILLRERLSSAMAEYLIQYCRLLEENSNEEVRQILDDINTEER